MKVLKLFMFSAVLLLTVGCLAGCHMLIGEKDWMTREEVADYIENEYPGKSYTLADKYEENGKRRDWFFVMDNYPECEFVATNVPVMNTLIPVYDHTVLYDNVYGVLERKAISSFTETMESVYGAEALECWKGVKDGDKWVPILIEINDILQFDMVKEIIDGYQTYFSKTYPGFEPAYFNIRMKISHPVTRLVDKISNPKYYHTGFWGSNEGMSWSWEDYSYTDDIANQERIDSMRSNVIEYASIYYCNVAGVTDEMRNGFAQKVVHGEDYHFEDIHHESYTVIDTGFGSYIYAVTDDSRDSNSDKLYVTRQTAYELFRQCGLKVSGADKYRECFTVIGIDGSTYQFVQIYNMKKCVYMGKHYDYTIDGEQHSFDNGTTDIEDGFEVDSDLIKRIAGIDICKQVIASK